MGMRVAMGGGVGVHLIEMPFIRLGYPTDNITSTLWAAVENKAKSGKELQQLGWQRLRSPLLVRSSLAIGNPCLDLAEAGIHL
jgi:hypothetical protein